MVGRGILDDQRTVQIFAAADDHPLFIEGQRGILHVILIDQAGMQLGLRILRLDAFAVLASK